MSEFLEPLQENPNKKKGDEKKKKKSTPKKQLAFESDPKYRCRYYEAEYPELEQVVVVQVWTRFDRCTRCKTCSSV